MTPIACPCGKSHSRNTEICPTCGLSLGAPNVNEAEDPGEVKALQLRYNKALAVAEKGGYADVVEKFSTTVDRDARAVVNADLNMLNAMVEAGSKSIYTTYAKGVQAQARAVALPEDDKRRLGVESMLFGSYAMNIRYAALSINNRGLNSYNDFAITLRNAVIENRASLLEDNSFVFVRKHSLIVGDSLPPGFRCSWKYRSLLAVSKLHERLKGASESDFGAILLGSTGDRSKDEFIEVYIYHGFDKDSIETVLYDPTKPSSLTGDDLTLFQLKLKALQSILQNKWKER
jgi:hypothetical protein